MISNNIPVAGYNDANLASLKSLESALGTRESTHIGSKKHRYAISTCLVLDKEHCLRNLRDVIREKVQVLRMSDA